VQAGCTAKESFSALDDMALLPHGVESTDAGSLVAVGRLCEKEPAAEVWDASGTSRIVSLARFWRETSYSTRLLKGAGDELWAIGDPFMPALHFRNGGFEAVPDFGRPFGRVFVSRSGALHAADARAVYRFEGSWVPIATLVDAPARLVQLMMDGERILGFDGTALYRARPGAPAAAPAPGDCATPFVYLYKVHQGNARDYSYPTTRQALSTFPALSDIELVEFDNLGRRLGVKVKSRAQGEAVILHVKAAMKDEAPRFLCYAPDAPRTISMSKE
jgi:hypothetical protein